MTDKELMQQALDALESVFEGDDKGAEYWTVTGGIYEAVECMNAMRALRVRLAQPEPEPVAWIYRGNLHPFDPSDWAEAPVRPLYEAPPQREWQGLTDEEIRYAPRGGTFFDFARAVETKLKEKNT